jgi:hypothetical protein
VDAIAGRIERGPLVTVDGAGREASRRGVHGARVALVAAAVLVVAALGAVLATGSSDPEEQPTATSPEVPSEVIGVVPSAPPTGQVLTWASHTAGDGWEATTLRYHGYSGLPSVEVSASTVAPGTTVAESDSSGSVELWGGREVVVDEEGTRARFVDPAGLLVEVTGVPDDVAAFVPSLAVVDRAGWAAFMAEVSADVAGLPIVAELATETGGPEGFDLAGADQVRMSVHAHAGSTGLGPEPEGGTGTRTGVVAGTCLELDGIEQCRPGEPMGAGLPDQVATSYDVLVDGDWWQFGWSTGRLSSVDVQADRGGEVDSLRAVDAFWYYDDTDPDAALTWFAVRLPADATRASTEQAGPDGISGYEQVRPAS